MCGTSARLDHTTYRYEAICRDRSNDTLFSVRARTVVLGAGVVGSASILLRSRAHLERLSRQVGRNVTTNGMVQTIGLIPDDVPLVDMYAGRSHSGIICYDLFEALWYYHLVGQCTLPLYMYSGARITHDRDDAPYWGREHLDLVKEDRHARSGVVRTWHDARPGADPVWTAMETRSSNPATRIAIRSITNAFFMSSIASIGR